MFVDSLGRGDSGMARGETDRGDTGVVRDEFARGESGDRVDCSLLSPIPQKVDSRVKALRIPNSRQATTRPVPYFDRETLKLESRYEKKCVSGEAALISESVGDDACFAN